MNGAGRAAETAVASRRAAGLVVAVLCLLLVAKTADGLAGSADQVPFAAALFVLPLLYALPATRRWWAARRWWLLAA
jgi:hypothetical protein